VFSGTTLVCVVEIGYTRPEKLKLYHEHEIKDVRWYDKKGRLHSALLPDIQRPLRVAEIAQAWRFSHDTVRRIFDGEEGVLKFGHETLRLGRKYRRRYYSLRIPIGVSGMSHVIAPALRGAMRAAAARAPSAT
jgi:hypothetical protein